MAYTPQTWVDGVTVANAERLNHMETGISDAHTGTPAATPESDISTIGGVRLETFPGATDNAKLGNAMSYAAAQTYKPPILLLENRVYGSFTTPRDLYSGFKLIGNAAFSNQYRGALSTPQRVDVQTSGAWLRVPSGQTFDVQISNLSFYSQSSTTDFLGGHNSGVLWTSLIRDVGFSLFRHVLGSPSTKLLNTVLQLDGWWNINNSRGVAVTVGGSDSAFWPQGCLLDSPTSITNSGGVPYHLWFDFQEKSNVGPMFITCENIPAAVRVSGSSSATALIFSGGIRMEGRNAGASSLGSVLRVEGARITLRDAWLAYGYSGWSDLPVGMRNGVRSGEGGVVSCFSGARVLFDGCYYSRAGTDGVGQNVPWIYGHGSGTQIRVRNAQVATDGGSFTDVPVVATASGATVDHDDTVRTI